MSNSQETIFALGPVLYLFYIKYLPTAVIGRLILFVNDKTAIIKSRMADDALIYHKYS